jgi:hypothetical protein
MVALLGKMENEISTIHTIVPSVYGNFLEEYIERFSETSQSVPRNLYDIPRTFGISTDL